MRRACLGELVQIDGCEHQWFEDRAPTCTAIVYVDCRATIRVRKRVNQDEKILTGGFSGLLSSI
jgi:hypothetical protein